MLGQNDFRVVSSGRDITEKLTALDTVHPAVIEIENDGVAKDLIGPPKNWSAENELKAKSQFKPECIC